MSDDRRPDVPLATPFGRQVHGYGGIRGTGLSAALHVAAIALLLWLGRRHFFESGPPPGEGAGRGGGGGGGIRGLAVFTARAMGHAPTPAPPPVKPPEQPLAVPQQVQPLPIAQPPVDSTPPAPVAPTSTQPGMGPGQGTGLGPGAGSGTGGGTGGGVGPGVGNDTGAGGGGGRIYPPFPISVLLQPLPVPRQLHGMQVRVTFDVTERGDVVSVRTDPEIPDRGYRNEFLDRMRHYRFRPGYLPDGTKVPAALTITLTL